MDKEKQIEEMAKDLKVLDCLQHNPNHSIEYQRAIGLYALGYRKASDVAREIFEEIDILVDDWKHSRIQSIQFIAELAKLEKKYSEGGE